MNSVNTLPNYPPLDLATSPETLAQYIDSAATCEIPAFTIDQKLGRAVVLEAFAADDWVLTASTDYNIKVPKYLRELVDTIPHHMHDLITYPENLHFDGNEFGMVGNILRAHVTTSDYRAIFATSVEPAPDFKDRVVNFSEQQTKLWSGEVDHGIWKDVRLHQGQRDQIVVFRSTGSYPVAHDFQADRHSSPWKRKFDVLEFQRAADRQAVSVLSV